NLARAGALVDVLVDIRVVRGTRLRDGARLVLPHRRSTGLLGAPRRVRRTGLRDDAVLVRRRAHAAAGAHADVRAAGGRDLKHPRRSRAVPAPAGTIRPGVVPKADLPHNLRTDVARRGAERGRTA